MNPVVLIPTYIASRRAEQDENNILARYDHITPISEEWDLSRCLESLEKVDDLGLVVVLVAAQPDVASRAYEKARSVALDHPDLNVAIVGEPELKIIRQYMEQLNMDPLEFEVGLEGYSAVRNLGLMIADIFGFDAAVFIDDDVVIEDPTFLERAMYGLGKLTRKGIPILAKSGFYLNDEDSYYSKSGDAWYDRSWQQGRAFNAWISHAMRGPRLSRSLHVCGGCLVIHKEAFKRLAFDPWITRGEDLDYMLDLRMYGSDIWFDNTWVLRHLPPDTNNEGERFCQDVYRWIYEYRKLEYSHALIDLQQVKPAALRPYPGPLLEPGVTRRVRRTARLRSLVRPNKRAYRRAARVATNEASEYAEKNCSNYFEFQYVWPEVMDRLDSDGPLAAALVRSSMSHMLPNSQDERGVSGEDSSYSADTFRKTSINPGKTDEIRLNIAE